MNEHRIDVRRLRDVDDDLAAQLSAQFDDFPWDGEQGPAFLANPDNLLVGAFWEGRLCGFATAHRLQRMDRRRAEVLLYEIGVEEAFQRRGLGRAIVEEVKRWAVEVGADEVWVLTEASNGPAMAQYAATGGVADPTGTTLFVFKVGAV